MNTSFSGLARSLLLGALLMVLSTLAAPAASACNNWVLDDWGWYCADLPAPDPGPETIAAFVPVPHGFPSTVATAFDLNADRPEALIDRTVPLGHFGRSGEKARLWRGGYSMAGSKGGFFGFIQSQ